MKKPKAQDISVSHKNMRRNRCVRLIENTSNGTLVFSGFETDRPHVEF